MLKIKFKMGSANFAKFPNSLFLIISILLSLLPHLGKAEIMKEFINDKTLNDLFDGFDYGLYTKPKLNGEEHGSKITMSDIKKEEEDKIKAIERQKK